MGPLDPLLTYIVFGLLELAEQRTTLSPFHPVGSGGEAGLRGKKSAATG
jgi:hypothetical protein